jgi:hypothetical protein
MAGASDSSMRTASRICSGRRGRRQYGAGTCGRDRRADHWLVALREQGQHQQRQAVREGEHGRGVAAVAHDERHRRHDLVMRDVPVDLDVCGRGECGRVDGVTGGHDGADRQRRQCVEDRLGL